MNRSRQLTRSHQGAITGITNSVVKSVLKLARGCDTSNIDEWFDNHRLEILELIRAGWESNRTLATLYLNKHAKENDTVTDVFSGVYNQLRVWQSIQATGPANFKRNIGKGADGAEARSLMLKALKGSVFRHAYAGSRDTLSATIARSRNIVGYRRASDGTPCTFCAMLISRGAVYSIETVNFQAHDNDKCLPEPLYRKEEEPPEVKKLQDLWNESTKGLSGRDAVNAFRNAYQSNK